MTADSVLTFNSNQAESPGDEEGGKTDGDKRDMPRIYFMGLIFIMVIVSTVVICFNGEMRKLKAELI